MNWEDRALLQAIDAQGYEQIDAVAAAPRFAHSASLANPKAFICTDGTTYWLKKDAQYGLMSELVGCRLAAIVGAGPSAKIINVPPEALPNDGSAARWQGLAVGVEDRPDTVNSKDLQQLINVGQAQAGRIVAADRALVVSFQTWIGVDDAQLLVSLTTGTLMSIDYGACFNPAVELTDPVLVIAHIPGIDDAIGRDAGHIRSAVDRIEAVTDQDILEALARMPTDSVWQSTIERRLAVGRWLCHRRARLRGVMQAWSL